MPLYMDVHDLGEAVTLDAVAQAHQADLRTQGPHDVRYLRYWVNEPQGRVFCLVEAPDADAASAVHREAHGLVAQQVLEVQEGVMTVRRILTCVAAAATLLLSGTAVAHAAVPHHRTGVDALRHATNRFHNLQRAQNAGYGFFTDAAGIACIAMPGTGGMGVHFVDSALVGDPAEHALHPEAMVYRVDNGRLRLAAVEYVVIASAWDATHRSPPRLFGHGFMLTPAGNRYGLPAYYSLHVWAWYHNPAGMFEMWNPRVTC